MNSFDTLTQVEARRNAMIRLNRFSNFSRREFFSCAGAVATYSLFPPTVLKAFEPLDSPIHLSYLDAPVSPSPSEIRFGYASITWNGEDTKAIEDIAALGFPGIQLRSNAIKEFDGKPEVVRALLDAHKLKLVALSSGDLSIDNPMDTELAMHIDHAKFLRDAGGPYLQVIGARPKNRTIVPDDYKKMGRLLSELGKRTMDLGVQVGFHNHMNSLGERPEETDWIFDSADPRYVKLELDVAHYVQGGGDPVKALEKYRDRLLFMHIKDVKSVPVTDASQKNYLFVELGRGRVDFPAIFDTLKKINYRGWAVIELDAVPDKSMTPKECAAISKKYVEEKLGYAI
jgi:inosose dehydratase